MKSEPNTKDTGPLRNLLRDRKRRVGFMIHNEFPCLVQDKRLGETLPAIDTTVIIMLDIGLEAAVGKKLKTSTLSAIQKEELTFYLRFRSNIGQHFNFRVYEAF